MISDEQNTENSGAPKSMNEDRRDPHPGLYEQLLTLAAEGQLAKMGDPRLFTIADVDPGDSHSAVAQYVEQLIAQSLSAVRGAEAAERQQRLVARLVQILSEALGPDRSNDAQLSVPLRRLLAIHASVDRQTNDRPDTPLSRSVLFTGTRRDPSLGGQLAKEIATADRVDVLCSFIRWSGLRIVLDQLRQLTATNSTVFPRLRIITTSYMGATDPKAVEALRQLPNTEVRVSYDTERTRLHAKAYIIHRETGFGCAYVGSANLSHAALSDGLEWTTKVSQYELPHLWEKIVGTFDTYWQDSEFEEYTVSSAARLRQALRRESAATGSDGLFAFVDLRPYPFQEEILDVLAAERENQSKNHHLLVAATGTGKTMVAAFDYLRWSRSTGTQPALLFVAHREEILRQSLATFRAVLRNHNFGDLLVGSIEPSQTEHLFCSIQSYNSRELWTLPKDRYHYVVVDEFHHAAAPSYRRLLDHVRPRVLLGLTATPERSDQLDVLHWFGGRPSAEIRLPDAINRRLLCPFQYFGISDSVDLDSLEWHRGGYRVEDLDGLYTGNDVRASLVVDKTREIVLDPLKARGLGFCVSVAHAEFMARFFNERGIPAEALSASSPDELRRSVQQHLRERKINFIFVVDLYNEGVDIPEVDTVLFLRPTESLTVFLQQFGRGLRLHEDKVCLTVLDFIGAQRREFRFAPRFRALSANPTVRLDDEVEAAFPHLPPGCFIRLERVAQQRVLENIRESLRLQRPKMVAALRELGQHLGRAPTLDEGLDFLDTTLDQLLRRGLWSRMLVDAKLRPGFESPDEERLASGLQRLSHIDDPQYVRFLLRSIDREFVLADLSETDRRMLEMLHVTLWSADSRGWSIAEADRRLRLNPAAVADLKAILEFRLAHTHARPMATLERLSGPLAVHAEYTRDEILVGLGHWSLAERPDFREGVKHLAESKVDAFFVTLQKTENEYSPTTMYEDYAISHDLFHWQSQSTTSAESATAERYINHRQRGYTPLLFVRDSKQLPSGIAAPYSFLGPCEYVSHAGSRPISVIWRMRYPIPARLLRTVEKQSVG
jgi:superfamily II DNA or RNA helicase